MQVRAAGLRITLLMLLTALAASILAMLRRPEIAGVPAVAPPTWVAATEDVVAPDGYPVKVKERSGILHEPGGRFYARTRPDRWYTDRAAAEADGYRAAKGS